MRRRHQRADEAHQTITALLRQRSFGAQADTSLKGNVHSLTEDVNSFFFFGVIWLIYFTRFTEPDDGYCHADVIASSKQISKYGDV